MGYGFAQIAYFANYPVLPAIFWTVAVCGAVAASVLLLLRSRYTVPVALVALCAQAGLDVISNRDTPGAKSIGTDYDQDCHNSLRCC